MSSFFTSSDFHQLQANPSEYVKLNLIGKIAHGYSVNLLSSEEKAIAADILRLLAQDISERIRINISEKFCRSQEIPYDIIKKLAADIEDLVAIPVVQFSELLTEQDLVEIIKNDNGGKQRAVARRSDLSEQIVENLITFGNEHTVEALIDSNGEKLSGSNSEKIITKFKNNESVISELININKANPEAAQGLLSMVSEDLRNQIIFKYKIPTSVVDSIISTSKESVSYSLLKSQISQATSAKSLQSVIAKLHQEKQLSFNLIIKILSVGNINFFLLSLAELASIPAKNVELLIQEDGQIGVSKLFEKAHLPQTMAAASKVLFHIVEKELAATPDENITQPVIKHVEKIIKEGDEKELRYILNVIKSF